MRCSRRSTTWSASVILCLAWCASVVALGQTAGSDVSQARRSQVEQAIVEAVRSRMGTGADVRIETLLVTGADRGDGRLIAMPEPAARTGRPIRFVLSRRTAGSTQSVPAGYAVATVHVATEHARASRLIPRGESCETEAIVASRGEVEAVLLQRLPKADEIAGARAVRDVVADEVLTRSVVALRSTIRSGDVVSVGAGEDGVRVETQGVATQSGGVGDTIRVVNRESRRSLRARVTGPGKVEVIQ